MTSSDFFDTAFEALYRFSPMGWQKRLFHEHFIAGDAPAACDLPTGLGKTSVMVIWLLALARQADDGGQPLLPRRLVYVVNRRTVVDQATSEASSLREALFSPGLPAILRRVRDALLSLCVDPQDEASPLAVSTLRGQLADNAEWSTDPARPAIVVGTIDMVGSRLLFSGYGRGFKSRPLHAGFLGQDALLVHDEAHLEPAFQTLVSDIEAEQRRSGDLRPLRVMALSATRRNEGSTVFALENEESAEDVVGRRVHARKGMRLHPVEDEKQVVSEVISLALEHANSGKAILIYLRRLEAVDQVKDRLGDKGRKVQVLTGTLRGFERDKLVKHDPIFARFTPKPAMSCEPGTVYLVCTSAGEVGVNISADHLVCDLAPLDSMVQRLGRVNRFGDGDARVDVVYERLGEPTQDGEKVPDRSPKRPDEVVRGDGKRGRDADRRDGKGKEPRPLDLARARTLTLLQHLPSRDDGLRDASPWALRELLRGTSGDERQAAFTPMPVIVPATDILFDAWALTSIREPLPGRPPVADWLHGLAAWEPPETHVAWREEVELISGELAEAYPPSDLLEDYPLKPHEFLRENTVRVVKHVATIAGRLPNLAVWVIDLEGRVTVHTLADLVATDWMGRPIVRLERCTVVLPPSAGGLANGMLSGGSTTEEYSRLDVADVLAGRNGEPLRVRVWDGQRPPAGMRLVRTIDARAAQDEEQEGVDEASARRFWHWYVRPRAADDDGSLHAAQEQELVPHLDSVERTARLLASKLALDDQEAAAVTLAARWHDRGKRRAVWQRSIGNRAYPKVVLAKSGRRGTVLELSHYRHEFGSLLELVGEPESEQLSTDARDLALHLIAAHHGRARPYFGVDEVIDPENADEAALAIARDVPRRFARLQRRYGRWGLAYLESLLRAADALASRMAVARSADTAALAGVNSEEDVP